MVAVGRSQQFVMKVAERNKKVVDDDVSMETDTRGVAGALWFDEGFAAADRQFSPVVPQFKLHLTKL